MKKKLALLLSAVMVMGSIPMTAFATTKNTMSKIATGTDGTVLEGSAAPILEMKDEHLPKVSKVNFQLTLSNAEWKNFDESDVVVSLNGTSLGHSTNPGKSTEAATVNMAKTGEKAEVVKVPNFSEIKGEKLDPAPADSLDAEELAITNTGYKGEDKKLTFKDGGVTYTLYSATVGADRVFLAKNDKGDFFNLYQPGEKDMWEVDVDVAGVPKDVQVNVEHLSNSQVIIEVIWGAAGQVDSIKIPMLTELKGGGDATVSIDPMNSEVSGGTHKFANVVDGATNTTIEKANDIQEGGSEIKSIIIKETAAGSLEKGAFQIKLSSGFEFAGKVEDAKVVAYPSGQLKPVKLELDSDKQILYGIIEFETGYTESTEALTISISGLKVKFDSDDVEAGDVCDATISGVSSRTFTVEEDGKDVTKKYANSGVTKQTIEVGVARDYSVKWTAENKTLPVFYSGKTDEDLETLKVTMEEVIHASWLDNRKTEISFPEGVKVIEVDDKISNLGKISIDISQKADTSVVSITSVDRAKNTGKAKIELEFTLSISPEFTGDIVATLGGSAVEDDIEATIGKAVAPFVVEAETTEVAIDYRNVSVSDIIIKEVDTGLLEKDKTLILDLEHIGFDGTPTVEIVEGDIKLGKISTKDGELSIKINTETSKTPAVLKVTDADLYLERSLPAGSYELSLKGDTFIQNYKESPKNTTGFDVSSLTVLEDFVEVVTAGRDQDDSTFTTKITVVIGASKLTAGKEEIALDVPAYISNGYTMLPVRAVIEALSGSAIVRWDDATKTVTITFGARVVSMTVGSETMNINGVPVQMSKACEITDSRAFIPLRDLGYALGLNDSKINWDDVTKTATLN